MIELTSRARRWVHALRQSMGRQGSGLRIAIIGGSLCSGYEYFVGFEDEPTKEDLRFAVEDLVLYIDPASYERLQGAKVDFVDSVEGSGFVVMPCREKSVQPRCCCVGSASPEEAEQARARAGRCPARSRKVE